MKVYSCRLLVLPMLLIMVHQAAAENGYFAPATSYQVGSGSTCAATADVNGNGKIALISANLIDGTLTVLTNNGSGGFGSNDTLNVGLSISSGPAFVLMADVNGDGKLDLISANTVDNTVTVLTNNRSGRFVLDATLTVGTYPVSVAAVDINGNGKIALVSVNENDGTLTVR